MLLEAAEDDMRAMGLRLWSAAVVLGAAAVGGAAERLEVVSAAPQGIVAGREPARIEVLFSAPVVALGAAAALAAPPEWLTVQPPVAARWRWAGTAELIGEPLAPLPRATRYTVTVGAGVRTIAGARLGKPFTFSFTTAPPAVRLTVEDTWFSPLEDVDWPAERPRMSLGSALLLEANQPIDPGALLAGLRVRAVPRPLPSAGALLDEAEIARLRREDAAAFAAWERFIAGAAGASAGAVPFTLEPDPERPYERFRVVPHGCWPRAATLEVELGRLRSLEGPEQAREPLRVALPTPWPPAPLEARGRAVHEGRGLDPADVRLAFTAPVAWRDVAEHVSVRRLPDGKVRRVKPFPDEWAWEEESLELHLAPLALGGGQELEICVGAEARDVSGEEVGFPWCTRVATAHRAPVFYLVEGDGVVEWHGPHVIPLKSVNVGSYVLRQVKLDEDGLLAALRGREGGQGIGELPAGRAVAIEAPADTTQLVPVDLAGALAGAPGVVLTRLEVAEVIPDSEYDPDEAKWLRRPRTALTQVTSLGLTVKGSGHEGLLVWVTELAGARPAAGVEVQVRSEENVVLWQGTTDAAGLVRTSAEVSLGQSFLITARRGEDLAYARTRWWDGHRGWEFNLPVDFDRARPLVGTVWADRGVVRPGERLHVKGVLRVQEDRALRLPPAATMSFVVRDSRDEDIAVLPAALDTWGAAEVEIAVPEGAALGAWQVLLGRDYDRDARRFGGEPPQVVTGAFRVAEFRRPKLRVRLDAEAARLTAGDPLLARASGSFLAGGPMAGAAARWSVRASRIGFQPPGARWAGFGFTPLVREDEEGQREEVRAVASGEGVLDASGTLQIRLARAETLGRWPTELELEAEAFDVDRQSSAATARLRVLPGEVMVGLRRPPFFVSAARGVETAVAAVSPEGEPRPGVEIRVELLRLHWESVRRREVSGRFVYESRLVVTPLAEKTVPSGREPASVRFELAEGGQYALRAIADDARGNTVEAAVELYAFGDGYTPWRMDDESRIELVPERERVAPGETARVLVKSPWQRATALITIERAGVLEAEVRALEGSMPVLELPIRDDHAPNVFVSVVLLRGRIDSPADPELIDPGRPAYRVGACELTVPPRGRRLAVTVTPAAKEYRPAQQAEVRLEVRNETGVPRRAALTVWAVDVGVLDLTRYRTPDLLAAFYARRGLGVVTADSRSRLVGRRSYGTKGDRAGGGGGLEGSGAELRRDFRARAFWRGDVVTDEAGRASVTFPLPDSLTTYRVMAVAMAGEAEFGGGEAELLVTTPIGLEPALPRFMRPGDRARAAVVVRNRTAVVQEAEVRLHLPPGEVLRLRGTAERMVSVPPGGSAEVGFGLVAEQPGRVPLRFTLTAGRETDAIELLLPVLPIVATETVATFFTTSTRAEEAIEVPRDVFPSAGGLELRLASSALVGAAPGLRFLLDYPHACAEQVASRVLGLTAAVRLGEGFAPDEIGGVPRAKALEQAAARLVACQRPDGAFAFWPGGWAGGQALSAHVAWALAEAREAGVAIDARVLERAAERLSRGLREDDRRITDGWTDQVLAVFALHKLGRAEPAYHQLLFEGRRGRPAWAQALLAAVMLEGDPADGRAAAVLSELRNRITVEARVARVEEPAPEWGWWVWWSEARNSAAALLALVGRRADPLAERLARGLLDHLARDTYRTTNETAWMLQALAAYRQRHETGGVRDAVARFGGRELARERFTAAPREVQAAVPMADLLRHGAGARVPLNVEVHGDGEVHAAVLLAYAPRSAGRPPLAQGLVMRRRFLDAKGGEVSRVAAGAEVIVEIEIESTATRRFVAVLAPLPAGLEPLDAELATTARRAADTEHGDHERDWWAPGFDRIERRDDRVMLYATELPPGRHVQRVLCRATIPGVFVVAPGHAEEMYAPEVLGTTAAATFEVTATR